MKSISRTELEQMARDGRGRPSVIKELAQNALYATVSPDSVQVHGVWVHYLHNCATGEEFICLTNRDQSETTVKIK